MPRMLDSGNERPANRDNDDMRQRSRRVAALAGRQHGVVTLSQLAECGLSTSAVSRWVGAGRLHPIHRGVYAVGHASLSREGAWLAAVLAVGEGAALTGRAAGTLWQISRFDPEPVRVVTPHRRAGSWPFVVTTFRHLTPDDVVVRDAIPVLRVAPLLLDLAQELTPWQLANVLHEAAFRRVLNRPELDRLVTQRRRRRGMATLRHALALHDRGSAGTKSPLEDDFLDLVLRSQLPVPAVNEYIGTAGGPIRADFAWRRPKLSVETDGRSAHDRAATRFDDEYRDDNLRRVGYTVLRFTTRAVREDPFGVVQQLDRHLRARARPKARRG